MNSLKLRLLALILALCTALPLVACNSSDVTSDTTLPSDVTTLPDGTSASDDTTTVPDATTTEPQEEIKIPDGTILAGGDVSGVCFVVGADATDAVKDGVSSLVSFVNSVIPNALAEAGGVNGDAGVYNIVLDVDANSSMAYSVQFDGKTATLMAKSDEFVDDAVNYFKSFAVNGSYLVLPDTYSFVSDEGPDVLSQSPEKYYYYEDVYTPTLVYTYRNSVDSARSRVLISGKDYTSSAVWENDKVTLKDQTMTAGDYTVLVSLCDTEGNIKVFETYFSCGDGSVMNLYSGELHAHTSDSDGKSTVEEAYKYARDVADLDFFAVTDHSNSFTNEVYVGKHQINADNFNDPGNFVALYGYEQTYNISYGYFGHLNSINYGTLTKRDMSLTKYYETVGEDSNAIIMFNHPCYRWGNFLEYSFYSEEYDKVVDLAEIKGKSFDNEYALSLTKGWHVSPMYNEDNHDENWGNAGESCGYALAPSLTRQNIVEALKKNRTYTTTDKSLKVYYSINGEWMGSILKAPDKLNVKVELSTEKSYGLGTVSLIGEDNIVVAQINLGTLKSYTWEFTISPEHDYYYVKVDASSSKTWCVTAPVWIEGREELTVESLDHSLVVGKSGTNDYRITATVKNNSDVAMTNVKVNFYTTTLNGFIEQTHAIAQTVNVGTIESGQTVTVTADVKYSASTPRVYACVKGEIGGKTYGAVKYMELSNLYITEIVPKTTTSGTDMFEYIELYNNSDAELDLSKFTLRYYYKAGAKAADLASEKYTWKLTGKIQPHSAMVIWVVSEASTLTVDDFNKNYGTYLVEGVNIIRFVGNNLPDSKAVQLEIIDSASNVVSRIWYNWANATDVASNKAIIFKTPLDCTVTCQVYKAKLTPTPGKVDATQIPKVINN